MSESMYFVSCPKQGLEMEAVFLHRVGFLKYFCPKQGQDFKSSAAPYTQTWVKYLPPQEYNWNYLANKSSKEACN